MIPGDNDTRHLRQQLRRRILAERDSLPPDFRLRASRAIFERLEGISRIRQAKTVFVYVNFRSEPETLPLITRFLQEQKGVAVPLTVPGSHMLACRIKDPSRELHPGYCSIPEPDPKVSPPIDGRDIDVVLLPGSVFDLHGGRLGYGGGYYDRFLVNDAPQAFRIGIAFEKQLVDRLPLMPHDVPLHILATEERLLRFGTNR